ncbi:hypothetical protein [Novosphingobium sp. Leaf2]|uniref:hypothetical protein n=1 Tax=Novosphingobium sp. Leaf2 TaxID=1735670 RepID=UPI000AA26053|nr:hypothetical protein [Novosphingobium sp. Leaf2]
MSRFAGLVAAVQQGSLTEEEIAERLKAIQDSVRQMAKDRPTTVEVLRQGEDDPQ